MMKTTIDRGIPMTQSDSLTDMINRETGDEHSGVPCLG